MEEERFAPLVMTLEFGDVTAVGLELGIAIWIWDWDWLGIGIGIGIGIGTGFGIGIVKYMQGKSHDSRDVAHIWAP